MHARQALATTLAAVLVAPFPMLARAAEASGVVAGTVKSVTGATLANVDIEFVNLTSGVSRTIRTDGAGALRGVLENGSYSVDARGYSIVSGPRTVDSRDGAVTNVDLTLQSQDPAAAPASSGGGAATGASGHKTGDIVALALFSGALTAAVIRAATVDSSTEDRHRPSTGTPTR